MWSRIVGSVHRKVIFEAVFSASRKGFEASVVSLLLNAQWVEKGFEASILTFVSALSDFVKGFKLSKNIIRFRTLNNNIRVSVQWSDEKFRTSKKNIIRSSVQWSEDQSGRQEQGSPPCYYPCCGSWPEGPRPCPSSPSHLPLGDGGLGDGVLRGRKEEVEVRHDPLPTSWMGERIHEWEQCCEWRDECVWWVNGGISACDEWMEGWVRVMSTRTRWPRHGWVTPTHAIGCRPHLSIYRLYGFFFFNKFHYLF